MVDTYSEEGGCLCGAIRYRVAAEPKWVSNCHCASCRHQTGASAATYAGFESSTFSITEGTPSTYESSPGVRRNFCAQCGTPLTYEGEKWAGEVHVHVGTFDNPEKFPPKKDGFLSEAVPWCNLRASL